MKKYSLVLAMSLFSMLILSSSQTAQKAEAAPAQKMVLKLGSPWPIDHFNQVMTKGWYEEVNQKAGGQVEIVWAGGPELFGSNDQLRAVSEGLLDMGFATASFYASTIPEVEILPIPFVWSFENRFDAFRNTKICEILDQVHQQKGKVKMLGLLSGTDMHMFSVSKISKMEDMKGQKIRAQGGIDTLVVKSLGGTPIALDSKEVYSAAERRIITGGLRPITAVREWGEFEVWKYLVRPAAHYTVNPFFVNLAKWNSLTPELQKLMADTFIKWEKWCFNTYIPELMEKDLKIGVEKHGLQVVELGRQEWQRWEEAMKPAALKWYLDKAGATGQRLVDELLAYGEKHR